MNGPDQVTIQNGLRSAVARAVRHFFFPASWFTDGSTIGPLWVIFLFFYTTILGVTLLVLYGSFDYKTSELLPGIGALFALTAIGISVVSSEIGARKRVADSLKRTLQSCENEASQLRVDLITESAPDLIAAKKKHDEICIQYRFYAIRRLHSAMADDDRFSSIIEPVAKRIEEDYLLTHKLLDTQTASQTEAGDQIRQAARAMQGTIRTVRRVMTSGFSRIPVTQ